MMTLKHPLMKWNGFKMANFFLKQEKSTKVSGGMFFLRYIFGRHFLPGNLYVVSKIYFSFFRN